MSPRKPDTFTWYKHAHSSVLALYHARSSVPDPHLSHLCRGTRRRIADCARSVPDIAERARRSIGTCTRPSASGSVSTVTSIGCPPAST
eukprot:3698770-Rhodomonas_salina.3